MGHTVTDQIRKLLTGDDAPEVTAGERVGWGFRLTLRWKSKEVFKHRGARDITNAASAIGCEPAGLYADTEPDSSGDPSRWPYVATFVCADDDSPRRVEAARARLRGLPVELALLARDLAPLLRPLMVILGIDGPTAHDIVNVSREYRKKRDAKVREELAALAEQRRTAAQEPSEPAD